MPELDPSLMSRGYQLHYEDGAVLEIEYHPEMVTGIVSGSGTVHTPKIGFDGMTYCGCQGCLYNENNVCSHMYALAHAASPQSTRTRLFRSISGDNTMSINLQDYYVKTTLGPFNEMMSSPGSEGGVPRKSGIAFSGRPKSGKTTLSFQLGYDVLSKLGEGNALAIDTEGSIHTYAGWFEKFNSRFGVDVDVIQVQPYVQIDDDGSVNVNMDMNRAGADGDHKYFVLDVRDLWDLLALHGRPAKVDTSKSKMRLSPSGNFSSAQDSAIGQFIRKNDIRYQVYDSVTNPLEIFTNRQEDRPSRSKATQWLMLQAQALGQKFDLSQAFVAHLSKNPANQYSRPNPVGGKAFAHQVKHSVYMQCVDSSDDIYQMRLFRHPNKKPWVDKHQMKLDSGVGFVEDDD